MKLGKSYDFVKPALVFSDSIGYILKLGFHENLFDKEKL